MARQLGMTHEQLLATMSQAEFTRWLVMQSVDPLFDPWLANAMNCAQVANMFGGNAKPSRFLPVAPKRPKTSPSQLKAYMKRRVKNGPDQIT